MDRDGMLARTAAYVRRTLAEDTSGHDWWHVHRVTAVAVRLALAEHADAYIVELGALLHDISDYKLNGGDVERGPRMAHDWIVGAGESPEIATTVAQMIATMSFMGAADLSRPATLEGLVVQDADRLDAIGAIGVARAFAYGGHAGSPMHDPYEDPSSYATAEDYRRRRASTVNHFHEKLLLLRDRMNTDSGRRLAERRHAVLQGFLDEFLLEWDGGDAELLDRVG